MTAAIDVRYGTATDKGLRRELNEDAYLAEYPLFLVADGMGGHEAGEVASALTMTQFSGLTGRASVTAIDVGNAVARARAAVSSLPTGLGSGPGTTLSGVAVSEQAGSGYWLVVNIGDSRTYLLSRGEFTQLSVDHSVVQELVELGDLTVADAEHDRRRNVITKAIGAGSDGQPDYWMLPASVGDRILVCSDGLTGEVEEAAIARVLREESDPQQAAVDLVHLALLHGGHDNVTVLVVDALGVAGSDENDATQPVGPRLSSTAGVRDTDATRNGDENPGFTGESHAPGTILRRGKSGMTPVGQHGGAS